MEEAYLIQFNKQEYFLTIKVNETLALILENDSYYWTGNFTKQNIELITKKVGQQREFNVFIKIFLAAVNNTIGKKNIINAELDLLESDHIERMKRDDSICSNNNSLMSSSFAHNQTKNKNKYLILTYNDNAEIKHFPLILEFQIEPSTTLLHNTIKRLKQKSSSESKIKEENLTLKSKINVLESHRGYGAVESEEIIAQNEKLKEEIASLKLSTDKQIDSLVKQIEKYKIIEEEFNSIKDKVTLNEKQNIKESHLLSQIDSLTQILFDEREKNSKQTENKTKEISLLHKDLSLLKENEKTLKVKINKLEAELDKANGRNNYMKKLNSDNKSFKSNNSVKSYNTSKASNFSSYSKNSNKSNSSTIRKNLQPLNSKQPYKSSYIAPNTFSNKAKSKPKIPLSNNINTYNYNTGTYKTNIKSVKSVYSDISNKSKSNKNEKKSLVNRNTQYTQKTQLNKNSKMIKTSSTSTFNNLQAKLNNVNDFLKKMKP